MELLEVLALLDQISPAILALVFAGGVVSALSPCTVPAALFLVGYVGGRTDMSKGRGALLSVYFVLGLALTLALAGAVAGWFGGLFTESVFLYYVTAAILLLLGLHLTGLFRLPSIGSKEIKRSGQGGLGAFLAGVPFAFASSPCTAPVTMAILAWVALQGEPGSGFLIMFAFGLGRSLPILLAGSFAGVLNRWDRVAAWSGPIQRFSGLVLIVLAFWIFWVARGLGGG
ncbi:MAG: cytochrome c biogenesis protein CcdA [Bacillota bacterium]|nr:cytochrome c biogenesis protein CcdA [Bacillota bacterium]